MLRTLAERIAQRSREIESWYEDRLASLPGAEPPIYSSVDLRHSGFKIGVVDTNLFPAGFNNLCETFQENGAAAFRRFFQRWHPSVKTISIFPEEHTRNLFYWKSVETLCHMLREAGMTVGVGKTDFVPDLILLNNDLSSGTPDSLRDVRRLVLPSPSLGWYQRRKSEHFFHYQSLAEEAGQILGIDPWLLAPLTTVETGVDLTDEICLRRLQDAADGLLARIRQKYLQYGVAREPYLFVKNNSGTYGIGVTHLTSGRQFLSLGRRLRNKLESAKGGQKVSEYILQEGIPTADLFEGKPIEPVVYLAGGEAIGTFYRIHQEKNEMENLNAPGMSFTCLCFHKVNQESILAAGSLLGRIASLASVIELNRLHAPLPRSA